VPDSAPNILKCRDDHDLVLFSENTTEEGGPDTPFSLVEGCSCSWLEGSGPFGTQQLRPRIEPWLTALCQSEHLSLLVGSGLTHAVHRQATGKGLPGMAAANFGDLHSVIDTEAKRTAAVAGRENGNIEDQIRVANELLRGLEILGSVDAASAKNVAALRESLGKILEEFADSVLAGEGSLVVADDEKREHAFNYLVSFLMSFASRTGTRERLHIFTTNYDRYIEAGADAAGLHLLDRFIGTVAPVFRSSRLDIDMHYNPPGIRGEPRYLEGVARFTKLHGSLDWAQCGRSIRRFALPFGCDQIGPFLPRSEPAEGNPMQLMIYPNASKDRETSAYPYVELFRDLAAAACRPNHTLVSFGYSFGDEHINRIFEDMLTIPSTHLVIISHSDPLERILDTYKRLGRHAQITLLLGSHVGDFQTLVDHYLPKPAIDRTTFRMAELLKARWGANAAGPGRRGADDDTEVSVT